MTYGISYLVKIVVDIVIAVQYKGFASEFPIWILEISNLAALLPILLVFVLQNQNFAQS